MLSLHFKVIFRQSKYISGNGIIVAIDFSNGKRNRRIKIRARVRIFKYKPIIRQLQNVQSIKLHV